MSDSEVFLGLEIGGTKLQLAIGDARGSFIASPLEARVDSASGGEGIRQQILRWIPGVKAQYAPKAIGVGFGGPVSWRTGRIARSHQISGWSDFPLGEWLTEHLGIPSVVDNDANVAALAEARLGAGRDAAGPMFYVTLGSGVGGGLILDGRIYHGAPPGESEIGHVRLDKSGTLLEERCSGWAVDRRIREAIASSPSGVLAGLAGSAKGEEARFLSQALGAGDPLAQAILSETADNLAFGLSHVIHLMHPECVVLGGGLAFVGEPLRQAVETALDAYLMKVFQPRPGILLSALKRDVVPRGALLLAAQG